MLIYLRGHDLWRYPDTARKMFQDRALQFGGRRGWNVDIDSIGCETDQYDPENPLYVISRSDSNPHQGSMRLMPMAGRTMIREHFPETLPRSVHFAADIWECTRFCVMDDAPRLTARALFAAGGAYMAHHDIKRMVAIFDEKIRRLYTSVKLEPTIIGAHRYGEELYFAGSWDMNAAKQAALQRDTGLSAEQLDRAIVAVDRSRVHGGARKTAA